MFKYSKIFDSFCPVGIRKIQKESPQTTMTMIPWLSSDWLWIMDPQLAGCGRDLEIE